MPSTYEGIVATAPALTPEYAAGIISKELLTVLEYAHLDPHYLSDVADAIHHGRVDAVTGRVEIDGLAFEIMPAIRIIVACAEVIRNAGGDKQ